MEEGEKSHVISWMVIVVYVLVFTYTKLKFFIEPSYFEIFWFSFRMNNMFLHYYFFKTAALMLAVVLLIIFPMIPYLSAIPCLIMFVYTIFFRPFIEMK